MKLAIYVAATTGYAHALEVQARRIISCLSVNTHQVTDTLIVIVTDNEDSVADALAAYRNGLPNAQVECIADSRFQLGLENYKSDAQLLIAQMRTAACFRAMNWGADFCLSLDSDVIPPANAIRCMLDMLKFDNGYYGVSFCPYPSHGGGPFLGGRGTPQQPILPCFYEDEKNLPKGLLKERDELLKDPEKHIDRLKEIDEQIKQTPPKANVFSLNGKKWRKRGWFDNAYPAIGKGAVVPIDWTGCGCTMMNREALALCDWTGYDGRGTEDLFLNFRKWYPAGIKIACIPHCPCDHIVRKKDKKGEYVHIMTGHASDSEHEGHLRQWHLPWNPHNPGDKHCAENDGLIYDSKKPS
jgi:hypothetical protein